MLAEADTADGSVQFIGPSTFSSNSTTITISQASGLAWFGGSSNTVFLDTSVAHTDTSTSRGKIDGWCKAGASGDLYIYGICGLATYGL